jgi:hypothetical protein
METESKLPWHEKGYVVSLFLGSQGLTCLSDGDFTDAAIRCGIGLGLATLSYGYDKLQKSYEHH